MKLKQEQCYFVDANKLENLVKEVYEIDYYNFVAIQECGNDCCHRFVITGKIDEFDQDDDDEIRIKKSVPLYSNRILLNLLCQDGHLEPGTYIVDSSW